MGRILTALPGLEGLEIAAAVFASPSSLQDEPAISVKYVLDRERVQNKIEGVDEQDT